MVSSTMKVFGGVAILVALIGVFVDARLVERSRKEKFDMIRCPLPSSIGNKWTYSDGSYVYICNCTDVWKKLCIQYEVVDDDNTTSSTTVRASSSTESGSTTVIGTSTDRQTSEPSSQTAAPTTTQAPTEGSTTSPASSTTPSPPSIITEPSTIRPIQ